MLKLDRRSLIAGGGALFAGSFAGPIAWAKSLGGNPFTLGVAAGDPWPDGFVIWTRLALRPLDEHGGMPMSAVPVRFEVSEDPNFRAIVRTGDMLARPELGHSVHVELEGLKPSRPYWYRFFTGSEASATGVARTAPIAGAMPKKVRIGVAGCQHYEAGYYTAYGHLAREQDVDAIFHYGDYIYEGRGNEKQLRTHAGDEIYTLDDYRRRYAQYKSDADLQAAHASAAFLMTYDDHEIDNNWAAQIDQDGTPPEYFRYRRAAAMQAWYENLPVRRLQMPLGADIQMFRRLDYGRMLRVHLLDTRQYRTDQVCGKGRETRPCAPAENLENGNILGQRQEEWLNAGLSGDFAWNLLAQQVMLMPLDYGQGRAAGQANMDSWSGYPASRRRLVQQIKDRGLTNMVVAAGDVHSHHAGVVPAIEGDLASRPVAAEFVATSISSNGNGNQKPERWGDIPANNPHCQMFLDQRGYQLLDFSRTNVDCAVKIVDDVQNRGGRLSSAGTFRTNNKDLKLEFQKP